MILRILNTLNTILDYSVWMFIIYLMRQDKARFTTRQLQLGISAVGIVLVILYQVWEAIFGGSLAVQNNFIFVAYWLSMPPVFLIYPGKGHKNIFFIALSIAIMSIGHGFGNLSEQYVPFAETGARLTNLLLSAFLLLLILYGFIVFVRRRFPALYQSENSALWKYLWIIMLALGLLQITVGSVYDPASFQAKTIVPARLVCLFAAVVILYLAGEAHRQAQEAARLEQETAAVNAAAAEKDRQYAEIIRNMEESRRLHHDMRQIYTVISGFNRPETKAELLQFCEETIEVLNGQEEHGHKDD